MTKRELLEHYRVLSGVSVMAEASVADTIAQQMGGVHRLRAMLGAQTFALSGHKALGIKWPSRQPSRGNYVEISLRPDDTYNMEFFQLRGAKRKLVHRFQGVYADQLASLFEKQTGYYVRL